MELTNIGPVSSARVLGVFYAAIGLIAGVIIAIVAAAGALVGSGVENHPILGAIFGVSAIVLLPVLYGVFGAVGGLVFSKLYNLIARLVGGIQVTLR